VSEDTVEGRTNQATQLTAGKQKSTKIHTNQHIFCQHKSTFFNINKYSHHDCTGRNPLTWGNCASDLQQVADFELLLFKNVKSNNHFFGFMLIYVDFSLK
jgi:hypothetical protein